MKNFKIGTLLILGFSSLLLFVVVLGVISYQQTDKIHLQAETMYEHPLKVRRAIGSFKADILEIRANMKDMFLSYDEMDIALDLNQIEIRKADAFEQIDIFYSSYLGPRTDIDSVKQAFIIYDSSRQETVHLLRDGKKEEALSRARNNGTGSKQFGLVLAALQKIDDFALSKGDELFSTSAEINNSLNNQLLFLVVFIFLVSLIISNFLLRAVRKPIDELALVAKRFHEGDMDARSSNTSKNELGLLAASFNTLVENIQLKTDLDEKFASLASLMMSEYDIKTFFQATINAIATHTGSQMAAIYLLSDDKKTFNHFESIGVGGNARLSFAADHFEGEFGTVLSNRKVHHLKAIPEDTRFIFQTVSGNFIPREIITLPIIADNEVVAIISLASVCEFSEKSILLIDRILVTLCTRVEGILAYHKMKEFSVALESQNRELDAQQRELAAQSAELTEQNRELEVQKNQLSEANKLKTSFLSNMSHELRTPLNSVIALSGVLSRRLDKQIPEEEHSYLEVIERNGKHLLSLINDVLDISRIESGQEEIEVTQFNIIDAINEIASMIRPQAGEKDLLMDVTSGDNQTCIATDAYKFGHILQNLIGNAVKFTEKGSVIISVKKLDGKVAIAVADTGIGISEEHLPYIFDEFRQADSGVSRRFGGTGLGLAIAKKYANFLGGNISVQSIKGKGSEFTLTLPLQYAEENRVTEERQMIDEYAATFRKPSFSTAPGATKMVMLVEDSEPAIIQLKDFLDESGYNVIVARNGADAMELFNKIIPDAIILDLMMPGIDGFQVLRAIRNAEITAHIPVLILTAKHITKDDLTFLKRNNVHQLIQKGDVRRDELVKAVEKMVWGETAETKRPVKKMQTLNGKPRVLVVEDNPDNMITVKAVLERDYEVLEAVNGKAGVEMAGKHMPNLILMDISLPEMDGIEAFKIIRNDGRLEHIPVIALTASALTENREVILAHGFDAYVAKPIDEKIFFKTINEILYGE